MMNYGCEGLNVVISGGTSGIGLAAAEKFLRDGANVYLLGRSVLRGAMAVQKLLAITERSAFYIPCNVASVEDCRKALQSIGGNIHILVNAAGVYMEQRLENVTEEAIANIFDTNVKGTMFLTQAALPFMYGGGSIVNIASDAGISGNYGCPVYCASKGAVVALTKALALDYAPNIRVNCVCPADVDTPLLRKQLESSNGGYTLSDMADAYPLGRVGRAEEIAHVICSVASPLNSFMTGSIIPVDGGLTAK
jgi:NAD(P)-dependent dehydrogenase (short-subunit alcohol dehydrogenase family)